jgi:CheY-like chemotaxis protein
VNDERLILVIEDDDATRSFLLEDLAADGFRVAFASSPQEGGRAIGARQPSGLDPLHRLRVADGLASRLDPGLPVIVLTGRSGEADRVRSFARRADDHLKKPSCRFPQLLEPNAAQFPDCPHRVARLALTSGNPRKEAMWSTALTYPVLPDLLLPSQR